mgnify:CR=1 FL=1
MDIFRKIMLGISCISFAVCCLFLNLMGGIGMILNDYTQCGTCLIISSAIFALSLISAFFSKTAANIISVITNIAATACYIYPISILNGIPNEQIPKTSIEILTSRIYPSVLVTIALAAAVFADVFSYERSVQRAERRKCKINEQTRSLTDDEKII